MDIRTALARVTQHQDLSTDEMSAVMRQIMTGEATPAQIGGFLVGLRMKGETIEEITGAATVMRELATPVHVTGEHLVDTCGTGGDGANLFNVSTAAAFVVAAAGGKVAKHGNRSVSSATGSADVLEAADVNLVLTPEQVARTIEAVGVGFLFAPAHHSAMKHAIGPRREMGIRTIFNVLGPMTNPAGVRKQVMGVFDARLCEPLAQVFKRLGSEHVLVVHADDGLDEISLAAPTQVAELRNGEVTTYTLTPEDVGLATDTLDGLSVSSAEESLGVIEAALGDSQEPVAVRARNLVALNAGAAIYAADLADTLKAGVEQALDAIGSGLALAKIEELASFTRIFAQEDEA
ncbi:anthranilate phosphoribosyltransferase [Hahella sp. SMD15-11]|uniref:Anthranilate phosphoribosyltransferase n=1 Tax=Thermohahella caldifontis TaxID=3142973 RepID=A0AB39UUD9_9GAMM